MSVHSSRLLYEFGPFRLEPDEHTLLRDGKPSSLTPKAFELLLLLVRHPGRLVTKDQIMESIWPGSFVEEANITVLISTLRKVLGETETGEPYITTVPKKGYRFSVVVTLVGQDEPAPESPSPQLQSPQRGRHRRRTESLAFVLLAALFAMAAYLTFRHSPAPRTLAVLPLQNLRHDPDIEFLGFSLADAVISKLELLSSVTVRPSSAIQKYRGREVDLAKVAAGLHVNTLLTGTFLRDRDDFRVTYQLIDVASQKILCKDVINLSYRQLITIHDNVARQIVKSLQLNLTPTEAERFKPGTQPVHPLAYEFYLRGIDLMASHNFPLAVKMLEKSAELDSKYPLTWVYLGQAYTSDATFALNGRESYRKAQAAYERALSLQPRLSEAQMFLANLLIDTGKVENAVPLLRDAISRNQNHAALHWELGYAYRFAGMLTQSVAECELARQLDPSVRSNGSVLNTYLYLGRYNDFLQNLPDAGDSGFFRFYRGFGEYHKGLTAAAFDDFNRAYLEDPTLYTGIGKAFADAIAHNTPHGLQMLRELQLKMEQRGVGDPEATYKIAQAYAALGDKTAALQAFTTSVESGFFPFPYFVNDPLLKPIRGLPGFPESLNASRQRFQAFQKRFF